MRIDFALITTRFVSLAFAVLGLVLISSHFAYAKDAKTPWKSFRDLMTHTDEKMDGRQAYATDIECRHAPKVKGRVLLRMSHKPFTDEDPPFHRWHWFITKHENVQNLLDEFNTKYRKGRLDLKFRIIASHTYETPAGRKFTCAVLYR